MSVTKYLQIPGYLEIEKQLFSFDESLDLILIYDSMNCDIPRKEKLDNIKILMTKFSDVSQKNKILCLVLFSMLNTTFGYSIIQEFEKFRNAVSNKYYEFLQEQQSDQHFIEILKSKKI
jgi:hypothetical protein